MPRDLSFRIQQGEQLRDFSRALRELEDGREIAKRMRRELRQAGRPMVPAVRAAVLALPSKGQNARRGRPSTRAQVARATALRVRASGRTPGVSIWVNPKRMPEGKRNIPAYMEGIRPFHRWRHPTFGDWEKAVQQPATPYFYRAVRPYEDGVAEAGDRVLSWVAEQIANR